MQSNKNDKNISQYQCVTMIIIQIIPHPKQTTHQPRSKGIFLARGLGKKPRERGWPPTPPQYTGKLVDRSMGYDKWYHN